MVAQPTQRDLEFVWLEITGRCQLECVHCYADSGPAGDHGRMGLGDWQRVIEQVADLGVPTVQFIGGEPTLHDGLPKLVDHALARGLAVEVYTNLVKVSSRLWDCFAQPSVSLATSWYSDDPDEHAAITQRPTQERTGANIAEAVRRSIPIRVGIVDILDDQRVEQAHSALVELGVTEIGYDRLRGVGRGTHGSSRDASQLCGQCAHGNLAVSFTGQVWPCVFARWLPVGDVLTMPLREVVFGQQLARVSAGLDTEFAGRPCVPNMCDPQCGPSCSPACRPAGNCRPVGRCAPDYR